MLLSASAAVESIAVNSDLENIRKIKKDACINNMWNKRERLKIKREVWSQKIPSGLTIFCRLYVGSR